MADEKDGTSSDGPPEEEPDALDRRSGRDRRRADRRGIEVPVERDRRSGWDRRRGERRSR